MADKMMSSLTRRFCWALLAATMAGAGIPGFAGPAWSQQAAGGGKQERVIQFRIADLDDNGTISIDEAAVRHEEMFALIDDDDDTLSIEEYMAVRFGGALGEGQGAGHGPRRIAMDNRKRARFKSMDKDSDGRVRKLEFLALGEEQHRAADTNGDGSVSIWEYRAARRF